MSRPDLVADSRVLWQLLRGRRRGGSAAERLEAFYAPQAQRYDAFRERMLHGRQELVDRMKVPRGGVVVELGGGTGSNAERFGERLSTLRRYVVVDLCAALLAQARVRAGRYPNMEPIEADAVSYRLGEPADGVLFSYSLTMIDDWRDAIENAVQMLKPGGTLAVVDFHLPDPVAGGMGPMERRFWRAWFAHDGVMLSAEHLSHLTCVLPHHLSSERRGRIPYLPGLLVPFYLFLGHKGE